MSRYFALRLTLAFAFAAAAGVAEAQSGLIEDSPEGRKIYQLLGELYDGQRDRSFLWELTDDLDANSADVRASARKSLLLLLRQSRADDRRGRSPGVHPIPHFRKPAIGFELRIHIAVSTRGGESPAICRWLLFEEPAWEINHAAYSELIDFPEVGGSSLLEELVATPHPSFWILEGAIAALEEADPETLTPHAQRLLFHPSPSVRAAVRSHLADRGLSPPTNEDPARIAEELHQVREVLRRATWQRIPPTREWIEAEPIEVGIFPELQLLSGWRIAERPGEVQVASLLGETRWVETDRLRKRIRLEDDPGVFAEAVQQVIEIRRRSIESEDDDEQRRLAALVGTHIWVMPVRWRLSIAELQLAAWADELEDFDSLAQLIFPELEDSLDLRGVTGAIRGRLGALREEQMIRAFVDDRDLERTAEIAKHLRDGGFGAAIDRERAVQLATVLDRRSSDFKEFRLPSAEEWKSISARQSRRERVEYLAARLRLLNMVQEGQPGGGEYLDPQWTVRLRDSVDLDPRVTDHPWSVMNPFRELRRLDLRGAEVEWLFPWLESEEFILAYDYYRFGGGIRSLHRVRQVIAVLIHDAVDGNWKTFPKTSELSTPGGRADLVARIRERIEADPEISLSQRTLAIVAESDQKYEVSTAIEELLSIDRADDALDTLLRRDAIPIPLDQVFLLIWLLDREDLTARVESFLPGLSPLFRVLANAFLLFHGTEESREAHRVQFLEDLASSYGLLLADHTIDLCLARKEDALIDAIEVRLAQVQAVDHLCGLHTAKRLFGRSSGVARDYFLEALRKPHPPRPREGSGNSQSELIGFFLSEWLGGSLEWEPSRQIFMEALELSNRAQTLHRAIVAGEATSPPVSPLEQSLGWVPGDRPCSWIRTPSWNRGVPHRGIIPLTTETQADPPR